MTRRVPARIAQRLTQDATSGWRERAVCTGRATLMDPPRSLAAAYEPISLRLCAGCPVIAECFDWVMGIPDLADAEFVAGGMTYQGRKHYRERLKARRKQTAREAS